MLQNAGISMHDDKHPISCKEQFSFILKQILINAEKMQGKSPPNNAILLFSKSFLPLFLYMLVP